MGSLLPFRHCRGAAVALYAGTIYPSVIMKIQILALAILSFYSTPCCFFTFHSFPYLRPRIRLLWKKKRNELGHENRDERMRRGEGRREGSINCSLDPKKCVGIFSFCKILLYFLKVLNTCYWLLWMDMRKMPAVWKKEGESLQISWKAVGMLLCCQEAYSS